MKAENLAVTKNNAAVRKASYSIETEVLDKFNKLASEKKYNKSKTVNNLIKMFLEQQAV